MDDTINKLDIIMHDQAIKFLSLLTANRPETGLQVTITARQLKVAVGLQVYKNMHQLALIKRNIVEHRHQSWIWFVNVELVGPT